MGAVRRAAVGLNQRSDEPVFIAAMEPLVVVSRGQCSLSPSQPECIVPEPTATTATRARRDGLGGTSDMAEALIGEIVPAK